MSSESNGRNGGLLQRRTEVRRERRCERRKKKDLYRDFTDQRIVGWRNRAVDNEFIMRG